MDKRVSRWMLCLYAEGRFKNPCMRRREHALSVRRWVRPSWRPISMPANSARFIVCEGGVEVTMILILVSEAGWVAAAPRGVELPVFEPYVYTKSCQFQARVPLVGVYVRCTRSGRGYVRG